jgi:ketosteroid isomerase-like protein
MSREAEALRDANALFYAALERLDLGAMEALWLPDPDAYCVHPGWDALIGWEDVRHSWERIFAGTSWLRVTPTEVRARVVGEVGVVTCAENISTHEGEHVGIAAARATNLFRRTPDGWRVFHHHASPAPVEVPPLDATPQ